MIGLELSPDNKFAAAYTNNNQTILLNTLISEFFIIDNPLGKNTKYLQKFQNLIHHKKTPNPSNTLFRRWFHKFSLPSF